MAIVAEETESDIRSQPRAPRFHEVLLFKIGVTVTACVGIVLLASMFLVPTRVEVLGRGLERTEATKQLLENLELLRGAWDPRERQRILDQASARTSQFAGPLHRILRTRDPRLLEPAIEYAGALGALDLRPTLAEMATSSGTLPPGVRGKAVLAAERLDRWSPEQLAEFLAEGTPALALAALEVCGNRQDAPWDAVLALLDHSEEAVAAAAIRAIPEVPPADLQQALWDMIGSGQSERTVLGLQALGRTRIDSHTCSKLALQLERLRGNAQLCCLELLGRSGRRLPDPRPVWRLVTSTETDALVRARALYCLEQTRSFDVQAVRSQIHYMSPHAKYFAARCLVTAGESDGADMLLDLVDAREKDVSAASCRLLSWMTGQGPAAGRKQFQDSLASMSRHRLGLLPAPGYDFGSAPAAPAPPR